MASLSEVVQAAESVDSHLSLDLELELGQEQASRQATNQLVARQDPFALATRTQLGAGVVKQHPWRSMGVKSPLGSMETTYCTGALISARSVLTAAHCIVNYGQGNHQQFYTTNTYGWTMARNGTESCFFTAPISKMFVPVQVVLGGQSTYWYYGYDYALVYLANAPQPIGVAGCPATAGYLQKVAVDDATMDTQLYRHDGYPYCSDFQAPAGCDPYEHYESLPVDTAADAANVIVEDNLAAVRKHDGITSTGHSGGPLWNYYGGNARIIGTHVGGGAETGFSKVFRRLTPSSINKLSAWQCLAGPCT